MVYLFHNCNEKIINFQVETEYNYKIIIRIT